MIPALCTSVIDCFRPDGSTLDLARPMPEEVDFMAMAGGLSRIARFCGTPHGIAFSVAQHSVMGTEALLNEGHDEITAALFLLHDGHEYFIGDKTRPFQALLTEMVMNRAGAHASKMVTESIRAMKAGWDAAIYSAAGLPAPHVWTKRQVSAVALMDERMVIAESKALFGALAEKHITRSVNAHKAEPLKLKGAIKPWGAMKAEEAFLKLLQKLIGEERVLDQRIAHSAYLAALSEK